MRHRLLAACLAFLGLWLAGGAVRAGEGRPADGAERVRKAVGGLDQLLDIGGTLAPGEKISDRHRQAVKAVVDRSAASAGELELLARGCLVFGPTLRIGRGGQAEVFDAALRDSLELLARNPDPAARDALAALAAPADATDAATAWIREAQQLQRRHAETAGRPAPPAPAPAPAVPPARPPDERGTEAADGPRLIAPNLVGGVTVTDIRSGKSYRTTVNLQPTLDRIAAGESYPHRNDGSVYLNRSRALPAKPEGYYREYVVPSRGIRGPGPQRLIKGREGEIYYTPDHYETFVKVQ